MNSYVKPGASWCWNEKNGWDWSSHWALKTSKSQKEVYSLSAIVTIPFGNTLVPIQVVEQTLEVGTQTAATLKGQVINNCKAVSISSLLKSYEYSLNHWNFLQTDQMGRVVNHLDTIQFSIKKASQLVKEIGRQVATDKCIMMFLFLIVCGVVAIIIVKVLSFSHSIEKVCDLTR